MSDRAKHHRHEGGEGIRRPPPLSVTPMGQVVAHRDAELESDAARLAEMIERQPGCPSIDSMGARFAVDVDGLCLQQAALPVVCRASEGAIDRAAVVALFDHAMGCAAGLVARTPRMVTTLDYRVDWCAAPAVGAAIIIRGITAHMRGRTVVVSAEAAHPGAETPVAVARGQFLPGILPGGTIDLDRLPAVASETVSVPSTSFEAFLGIPGEGADFIVPGVARLVGAVAISAFHGGLIAAAMDIAVRWRSPNASGRAPLELASLTLQYLRPAIIDRPLLLECETVRAGRTVATLDVEVRQEAGGAVCARGTAMLVAATG